MAATISTTVPQVLSEIRQQGGLKLKHVGKQFPASHGPGATNPATVWRWARIGTKTPNGSRIKLEVVKVGMSWLTSQAAVDRFVMALTGASLDVEPTRLTPNRKSSTRAKASEAAGRRLAAMGA